MRIDIVTLFPEMFAPLDASIVARARQKDLAKIGMVNPRDFTTDRHRTVDDRPYGGGKGMLMMAEPLYRAIQSVRTKRSKVVLLSPQGRRFDQSKATELAGEKHLILICGHYEGIDARVLRHVNEELSIGDFVLTGGEIPAMAIVDAVVRLLPGVLPAGATQDESFASFGLEHAQFTRPRVWRGRRVPEALVSGDHARIEAWRRSSAARNTKSKRPDLHRAALKV